MPSESSSLVSAICIFYNEERFLAEAIESVVAQTYNDWELLLVDDGSTDGSSEIARHFVSQYDQLHYLQHPDGENRGMSAARNLGIKQAVGQYVTFIDGDDVLLPQKIAEQVALLEAHPEASMICSATKYWRSWTGNPEDRHCDEVKPVGTATGLYSPPELLTRLYPLSTGAAPCMSSLLVRREAIDRVGGFEERFKGMYEDQAFLSKMYLHETVLVTDQWWDCYRQHDESACAVSIRSGMQSKHRHRFLKWFAAYLSRQAEVRSTVNFALWKALLSFRFPFLISFQERIKHLKWKIRHYARQLLPESL